MRIVSAAAAGLLVTWGFRGPEWCWLIPIGLVWAFTLVRRAERPRDAWWTGWAFGAGFLGLHLFWIRVVGWDAWILLALAESAFIAAGLLVAHSLRTSRWWPLWAATLWTAAETLRSTQPWGGLPWARLGYASVGTPLEHLLPFVGITGVTWLIAAACAGIACWRGPSARVATSALMGVVVAAVLACFVPPGAPDGDTINVAAIQGNVPGRGDDVLLDYRQVTANQVTETFRLAGEVAAGERPRPRFVVWPENSTAIDPLKDAALRSRIQSAVNTIGVPVLVGAIIDGEHDDQVLNQGIVWLPTGPTEERYTKLHPVPFGEYVPLRALGVASWVRRLDLVARDMLPGSRRTPLLIDDVRVADAICFDIGHDDVVRDQVLAGAELVTVQTSNAMFVYTGQLQQQLQMSRARAIETQRWVVVASINGLSAIIGPEGQVVATADRRTAAILQHDVVLSSRVTLAVRIGPWWGRISEVVALVLLGTVLLRHRRARRDQREAAAHP